MDIQSQKANQRTIKQEFYARGKLLLTGEYLVLDGATALALPTKLGQKMIVKNTTSADIGWKSLDRYGKEWFSAKINLYDFKADKATDESIGENLTKLLKNACRLNSEFLNKWKAFNVTTHLEFERDWGLGSSSTLTYMIAEWADVNPFLLHFKTYEGSGYDVACAGSDGPILYEYSGDSLHFEEIDWNPTFRKHLYFVHLNQKQSTQEAITLYQKSKKPAAKTIKEISAITEKIIDVKSLGKFQELLEQHDHIISSVLQDETIQKKLFPDFKGIVKSLGAWGGDFVLVASDEDQTNIQNYFQSKGFPTVVAYDDMIFSG